MPKISRRRYFKLMDRIIIDHCCDFYGQPNYSLMRDIAETERQNRRESWPHPLGIVCHLITRELIHEIQQEVLDQFPADAFASPPVPARPINPVAGYTSPKAMQDLPAHIGFWDPLYLYREHLELLRNLHALERRYLSRPDLRVLA